ncbi:hypothetical protein B6A42_22960 [Vibrio coralliilyticus]|nr:hypothetical protein B6A42_22960 [Vibrio coralliilyticus]
MDNTIYSLFPIVGQFIHSKSGRVVDYNICSYLKSNSVDSVIDAAIQGLGISALVKLTVEDYLKSGKLISVLDDYQLEPRGVYALYPHKEHLPPKVRVFMDFLQKHCDSASWTV